MLEHALGRGGRSFVEKAREPGCDDDPAVFDRRFERTVPPKWKPKRDQAYEKPREAKPRTRRP